MVRRIRAVIRKRERRLEMLSEFKCQKCQEKFLIGLRPARKPIRYCPCCGSEELEFVGTEEDLAVRIKGVIDQYNILQEVR